MNFESPQYHPQTDVEKDLESRSESEQVQDNLVEAMQGIKGVVNGGRYEYSQEDADLRLRRLVSRTEDVREILTNMDASRGNFELLEKMIEAMHTAIGGDMERVDRQVA